MSQHPAFRRAFMWVLILGSPLIAITAVQDADAISPKQQPCQLSTSGPTFAHGNVSYIAGVYCPGASVVQWTLTINRSGLPWASRSGTLTSQPRVSKRCVRSGPPITLRPILKIKAYWGPNLTHVRTYRGTVTSTRCAA